MNHEQSSIPLTQEDASHWLVRSLRLSADPTHSNYGYDLFIPNLMFDYLRTNEGAAEWSAAIPRMREISPLFFAAAWELCRRGILRPGVVVWGEQATDQGSAGSGFSVTPFGRSWLAESDRDDYVPTEPGRFVEMLKPSAQRFGPAFQARGLEAVRCYGAHCYLACCAMCGAAAETVLC